MNLPQRTEPTVTAAVAAYNAQTWIAETLEAILGQTGPPDDVVVDDDGSNVEILDSDFHELHPDRRRGGRPKMAPVDIGPNVFVGNGARILKDVTIGAHAVIGAGSVVTTSIPGGVIAAGNPARVIREL
jgi:acetyltransferase-like isoleucine patch superfamily enzyme